MPVVLRICVVIETAPPPPPPTSILVTSNTTNNNASSSSSPAAASKSPVSPAAAARGATPVATTAPSPQAASPSTSSPEKQQRPQPGKPLSSAEERTTAGTAATRQSTASPAQHKHHSHSLLGWFKKDKKTKPASKKAGGDTALSTTLATCGDSPTDTTVTAQASPTATAAPASLGQPSAPPSPHKASNTAPARGLPQPTGSSPSEPTQQTPRATPREVASSPAVQRSLAWFSIQLTPATTVKSVLQQVQDVVQRRLRATLCEDSYGVAGGTSVNNTPAGSFATPPLAPALPPQHTSTVEDHANAEEGKGSNAAASRAVHVTSPTSEVGGRANDAAAATAPAAAPVRAAEEEWCLCLQDSLSVFHWAGSSRHYCKTALLRAPFVTEVCLRSHAAFEDVRQQQRKERRRAERAAQQPASSAGDGGGRAAAAEGSAARSDGASSASSSGTSSGSSTPLLESEDDVGGEEEEQPSHPNTPAAAASNGGGKSSKKDVRKSKSSTASGSKRGGKGKRPHDGGADMTAKQFAKPSREKVKWAFLNGIVLPMAALKQRNPVLARHRQKPVLYTEVRVPRAMRAEPLDLMSSTAGDGESAAAGKAANAHGSADGPAEASLAGTSSLPQPPLSAPAPPLAPLPTGDAADGAHQREARRCSDSNGGGPPSDRQHTDTAKTGGHAGGTHDGTNTNEVSPNASSASTLPSRAPVQDHQDNAHATGDVAVRGGDALPIGLITHATALEDADGNPAALLSPAELQAWCRSSDAAHVKGLDLSLTLPLTREEDEVRLGLAAGQLEYTAALAAYRAVVPPAPEEMTRNGSGDGTDERLTSTPPADAELTALLRRKVELQACLEEQRQAARQRERLTTLAECLEKELHDWAARRELLTRLRVN